MSTPVEALIRQRNPRFLKGVDAADIKTIMGAGTLQRFPTGFVMTINPRSVKIPGRTANERVLFGRSCIRRTPRPVWLLIPSSISPNPPRLAAYSSQS
jgi:hypothetical protein